jgi:hydroxymethylpyrimidine pyrophosphatase-like HAD family hydrolase
VLALAKELGIHAEEIIAVGDSENDLPMLQVVGMPVAMGNAMESVFPYVKYITESNMNDGVATLIEKFILNEG